jgi:pimeloyl-ACP methyl ester carboxylesterase
MLKRLIPIAAAAVLAASGPRARADTAAPAVAIETGYLKGAQFAIATPPRKWNGRLLLLAHGYRPEGAPLIADLHPDRASLKAALDDGWIVATTSYRRNGIIVADAIADLDALRAYVAQEYGEPERTILEGESTGGLIITIMAERELTQYSGAIAFDATLYVKEPDGQVGLSLLPRIPLLFVATERESVQPKSYLTALVARPAPVIQPVLFLIGREGHTNINQPEHLEAFQAMNAWLDRGREAIPAPKDQAPYFDATIAPDPGPSTAEIDAPNRTLGTRVADLDAVYGNVLLEAQAADFQAAGIPPMTYCTVHAGDKEFRTLYGRTYSDVKKNAWVAFPDADGRTVLAQVSGNAAAAAGLARGTAVRITAVLPTNAPSR